VEGRDVSGEGRREGATPRGAREKTAGFRLRKKKAPSETERKNNDVAA
jgi:hypothetical protein